MPRSRTTRLWLNGKAVSAVDPQTKKVTRVKVSVTPRARPVAVENNIVLNGKVWKAVNLSGKAIRLLGTKMGLHIFRKDLITGAVRFKENDSNISDVYRRLGSDMFISGLLKP